MICRICDSRRLTPVLDLGLQPWANNFLRKEDLAREPRYPLRLVFCEDCRCAQLDYTVPKEVMFSNHTYVSGTTATLRNHFAETARTMQDLFFKDATGRSVLDIGSNDGTQLLQYKDLGFAVQGVESCGPVAQTANEAGVPTLHAFFNRETAATLGRRFDLINAAGVFFHLEELHSVTEGVRESLTEDGVFVVQFLYMKNIVENLAFDQIYHEHLLYYTLRTIEALLRRHGLSSFDACVQPIHGGSVILMAGHEGHRSPTPRYTKLLEAETDSLINERSTYEAFARRIGKMKEDTLSYLRAQKAGGKRIFGFGAPVKGNTLLNYCGIGTDLLDCLVEKNPLRRGLYSPGMHIPLLIEDEVGEPPDIYFVLAWNFKKEILANNRHLVDQGVEFYFPVNPPG